MAGSLSILKILPSSKNSGEFSIKVSEESFQNLSQTAEMQKCLTIVGAN